MRISTTNNSFDNIQHGENQIENVEASKWNQSVSSMVGFADQHK